MPEAHSKGRMDPYADAKIIIVLKISDPRSAKEIVGKYGLLSLGKNEIFDVYKNPKALAKGWLPDNN